MMRTARKKPMQAFVDIAGIACATDVFVIDAFDALHASDVAAPRRGWRKVRGADSESRFLAIKKFSCRPASCLITARQKRFLMRIAAS
jgi:hypothetical protein